MTIDEAIEHEEQDVKLFEEIYEIKHEKVYNEVVEKHRQLAKWLKELKKYKEKDTPKLVIYSGDGYADGRMVYDTANCPNCEYEFEEGYADWNMPYCCNCGQALKWEVEE